MTRDFDLIRELLVFFDEKVEHGHIEVAQITIGGYTGSQIHYHLLLMYQAGLLDCEPKKSKGGRVMEVIPFNLTWHGHEFLAKVRSDEVWEKIKTTVATKGGSLVFAVIDQMATRFALTTAGL